MGIMSETPFSQSSCEMIEPKARRRKKERENETNCFKLFSSCFILCLFIDLHVSLYLNSGIWVKENSLSLEQKKFSPSLSLSLLPSLPPSLSPFLCLSHINRHTHTKMKHKWRIDLSQTTDTRGFNLSSTIKKGIWFDSIDQEMHFSFLKYFLVFEFYMKLYIGSRIPHIIKFTFVQAYVDLEDKAEHSLRSVTVTEALHAKKILNTYHRIRALVGGQASKNNFKCSTLSAFCTALHSRGFPRLVLLD